MPDPISATADYSKLFATFQWPGFSVNQVVSAHRRNVEAAVSAAQVTFDLFQTVLRRQVEILSQSAAEGSSGLQHLFVPGAPAEKLARNTDLLKSSIEKSLLNLRDVSDILAKSGSEATEILTTRMAESLGELTGSLAKV